MYHDKKTAIFLVMMLASIWLPRVNAPWCAMVNQERLPR
jgi:hypothetical protein